MNALIPTPPWHHHKYKCLHFFTVVSKLPVIEEEDADQEGSVKRESRVLDYSSKISNMIKDRKSSVLHGLRKDSSAGFYI